jgi:uncharacterized protein YndB with AHSA1/START domain
MVKWIAGGCVVVILIVGAVMYAGYKQMSSVAAKGPTVTVGIAATPERVFASMANADSLSTWFMTGSAIRTTRKGMLVAGDSIFVQSGRDSMPTAWIIDTIVPNQLIVLHWVVPRNNMVIQRRRDSIFVVGDSTMVTGTVEASLMPDSLSAMRGRGGVSGGIFDMASTMGVAGARMQTEQELRRLKHRIEGPPVVRP